ncbi:hypothetical protein VTN77DRAFT_8476 [Rasamsonia byssochlamydoides]|uniref:uncharacterized protein n=1 Tax=Rasamsonia byssochlamydoides TaxID=89139 RepID=UPI0037433A78
MSTVEAAAPFSDKAWGLIRAYLICIWILSLVKPQMKARDHGSTPYTTSPRLLCRIPAEGKKELVEQSFADCAVDLKRILYESNDRLVIPPLGVGVNLALLDSLNLARAIVAGDKDKVELVI